MVHGRRHRLSPVAAELFIQPVATGILMRFTNSLQQSDQIPLLDTAKMSQLPLMHFLHARCHFVQQRKALRSDGNFHNTTVLQTTLTYNQLPLLKPIEHPGRIRASGNQSLPKSQGLHRGRMSRSQKSQSIVLLRGQLELPKQFIFQRFQTVVCPPKIQEGFLLWRIKTLSALWLYG